jgi:hypothetical protein
LISARWFGCRHLRSAQRPTVCLHAQPSSLRSSSVDQKDPPTTIAISHSVPTPIGARVPLASGNAGIYAPFSCHALDTAITQNCANGSGQQRTSHPGDRQRRSAMEPAGKIPLQIAGDHRGPHPHISSQYSQSCARCAGRRHTLAACGGPRVQDDVQHSDPRRPGPDHNFGLRLGLRRPAGVREERPGRGPDVLLLGELR